MPLSAIVHAPHQFGIMIHTVRAGVTREKRGEWVNGNVGNRREGRRTILEARVQRTSRATVCMLRMENLERVVGRTEVIMGR